MMKVLDNNYQNFFFAFLFKFVKPIRHLIRQYANAPYFPPPPKKKNNFV